MRMGVAGTHGIAARRDITDVTCAGADLFGGPIRILATGTRINTVRHIPETINARSHASGSTKGAT
ncbi:hypothetical protein [Bradyrhizobium sp. CCBAU 53421]|uniref:hypothetical protein n=1 Tax=Bradyrhizobium sp. CCBAU 53421 TaxID=1325120 RepID=UPI00188C6A3B|nr:hypothetical protein [Bradyrhizobium sp. CCBAU 53421]